MKTNTLKRISQFMKYTLLMGAILFIIIYLILVFFRIRYPFELEWMEGGSLDHVMRILSGLKLYGRPSLEFTPFIYAPLYFYLSAGLSKIIGQGLAPLRMISLISSLGCIFIIFLFVKRETKSTFWGILASCLFAATFKISGAWFDIARVDSLFLFLLLMALYLIRFHVSVKSYVLAALFVFLSFLTKQTALIVSLPVMLYCAFSNRRLFMAFTGTLVIAIGISTVILDYLHGGWYSYYIFTLPGQHPIVKEAFFAFCAVDITPVSIASSISLFYLFNRFSQAIKEDFLYYSLITAGMVGGSFFSRLHSGGYNNVLFPAYAIISILFGLGIHAVFELMQTIPSDKRALTEICLYLICILQFACLVYDPFKLIPTNRDLSAGRKLIDTIAQGRGDIFIPYHPYLSTLAGKSSYSHLMALSDVLRSDNEGKENLISEVRQAIQGRKFSAIILDSNWVKDFSSFAWLQKDIEKYYTKKGLIFDNEDLFWPTTGIITRPEFIYIPAGDEGINLRMESNGIKR